MDFLFVLIELFSVGVTAEALRTNIDWKSALMKRVGQFRPNFHVEGYVPFVGRCNEYQPKGGDGLRLGSKGRYSLCVGSRYNCVIPLLQTSHI